MEVKKLDPTRIQRFESVADVQPSVDPPKADVENKMPQPKKITNPPNILNQYPKSPKPVVPPKSEQQQHLTRAGSLPLEEKDRSAVSEKIQRSSSEASPGKQEPAVVDVPKSIKPEPTKRKVSPGETSTRRHAVYDPLDGKNISRPVGITSGEQFQKTLFTEDINTQEALNKHSRRDNDSSEVSDAAVNKTRSNNAEQSSIVNETAEATPPKEAKKKSFQTTISRNLKNVRNHIVRVFTRLFTRTTPHSQPGTVALHKPISPTHLIAKSNQDPFEQAKAAIKTKLEVSYSDVIEPAKHNYHDAIGIIESPLITMVNDHERLLTSELNQQKENIDNMYIKKLDSLSQYYYSNVLLRAIDNFKTGYKEPNFLARGINSPYLNSCTAVINHNYLFGRNEQDFSHTLNQLKNAQQSSRLDRIGESAKDKYVKIAGAAVKAERIEDIMTIAKAAYLRGLCDSVNASGKKALGDAANNVGIRGEYKNNIFKPKQAGSNFFTFLTTEIQKDFNQVWQNKEQNAALVKYAKTLWTETTAEVADAIKDKLANDPNDSNDKKTLSKLLGADYNAFDIACKRAIYGDDKVNPM